VFRVTFVVVWIISASSKDSLSAIALPKIALCSGIYWKVNSVYKKINDWGSRLLEFDKSHDPTIANTLFPHKPSRTT
jgi:hypothetical protein